jgi:hypothetical protein
MEQEKSNEGMEKKKNRFITIGLDILHSKAYRELQYGPAIKCLNWLYEKGTITHKLKRVKKKAEGRRTWTHGVHKYLYLFARKIFDADTGYALTGLCNHRGVRYYRPYRGEGAYTYSINADVLENAIMEELFDVLGNKRKLQEAVLEGNPLAEVAEKLHRKLTQKEKDLKSVGAKMDNVSRGIENYEGDDLDGYLQKLKPKIKPLSDSAKAIEAEIQSLKTQLATLPTEEEIDYASKRSKDILKRIKASYFSSGHSFRNLTPDGKKKLIDLIFGGKDASGKRYGIYVKPLGGRPKRYRFEAYGRIGSIGGALESRTGRSDAYEVYDEKELYETWRDADGKLTEGIANLVKGREIMGEEKKVKADMVSKRHAYHCLCLHQ